VSTRLPRVCLPGRARTVVLTSAALAALSDDELGRRPRSRACPPARGHHLAVARRRRAGRHQPILPLFRWARTDWRPARDDRGRRCRKGPDRLTVHLRLVRLAEGIGARGSPSAGDVAALGPRGAGWLTQLVASGSVRRTVIGGGLGPDRSRPCPGGRPRLGIHARDVLPIPRGAFQDLRDRRRPSRAVAHQCSRRPDKRKCAVIRWLGGVQGPRRMHGRPHHEFGLDQIRGNPTHAGLTHRQVCCGHDAGMRPRIRRLTVQKFVPMRVRCARIARGFRESAGSCSSSRTETSRPPRMAVTTRAARSPRLGRQRHVKGSRCRRASRRP